VAGIISVTESRLPGVVPCPVSPWRGGGIRDRICETQHSARPLPSPECWGPWRTQRSCANPDRSCRCPGHPSLLL